MDTQILTLCPDALAQAGARIREGQLVAFPTETVYGLGANAMDPCAVSRIFEAKGRPGDNPLIIHISALDQLSSLIDGAPNAMAQRMMSAFWPGPLTMIFPKSDRVPLCVTAGLDTVAIRFPAHPAARALIDAANRPIAAPSANRSGRPSPTTAQHVWEDMAGRIPLILDGGPCEVGVESTVVDVCGGEPRILRPGGVTREMIAQVAGSASVDAAVMRPLLPDERPRSPGMKYRHYAPQGQLTIIDGQEEAVAKTICSLYDSALSEGHRPLILALEPHKAAYAGRKTLSLGRDAGAMAHNIFAVLREADAIGADRLFSEAVDAEGVGLAVMNRLGRAAAFHIVHAEDAK